jgi:hypothetical protein
MNDAQKLIVFHLAAIEDRLKVGSDIRTVSRLKAAQAKLLNFQRSIDTASAVYWRTPEGLRARAEECRAIGDTCANEIARGTYLRMAETYDLMAKHLEHGRAGEG